MQYDRHDLPSVRMASAIFGRMRCRATIIAGMLVIPALSFARAGDADGNGRNQEMFAQARQRIAQVLANTPMSELGRKRLHPLLQGSEPPTFAVLSDVATDMLVGAYVMFRPDVDILTTGRTEIEKRGGTALNVVFSLNALVISAPFPVIQSLADNPNVLYVEPMHPRFQQFNAENRFLTQADVVQEPPYNLDGSGISVLVFDVAQVNPDHVDLTGRVNTHDICDGSEDPCTAHATHVGGTIGGDGTASAGTYRGLAPGVVIDSYISEFDCYFTPIRCTNDEIAAMFGTDPGDLEDDYWEAINVHDVDIANNSVGLNVIFNHCGCVPHEILGDYTLTSSLVDGIAAGSLGRPLPIIWAVGNERGGPAGPQYNVIPPPVAAKNPIAVGAINANDESMTMFSSFGPTDDGRIKPDLVAPGCQVGGDGGVTSLSHSWWDVTGYTTICGTSMAAPTVTGGAAQLLQAYAQRFPGRQRPKNSMVRVLLIHTAKDLFNTGPDFISGYGLVQVKDAVDHVLSGYLLEGELVHGESHASSVDVRPGTEYLKFTLAWDDVPGLPLSDPALVNDLDLVVRSPNGTRYYPWTLDPTQPEAAAVRTREDHLNIIEQVFIATPEPGVWTYEVFAFDVPSGPQPWTLALDGGAIVTIPAASEWHLVAMTLLVLISGTLLMRRQRLKTLT